MGGVPSWWPGWLPSKIVYRGLDLQGGLYLLLHVETDKAVEQAAENLVDEIRLAMRKGKLRYQSIKRFGRDGVEIKLPADAVKADLIKLLKDEFKNGVVEEIAEGVRLRLDPKEIAELKKFAVDQSIQTIRSRIDQFGVAEPSLQKQGEERILLQLPGLNDPARAKTLIGRTARLEFKLVDEKGDLAAALAGNIPPDDQLLYEERGGKKGQPVTRQPLLLKKRTNLTGDLLTDARVNFDQFGEPLVSITFNHQGARKFAQLTGEHVGERMAIVLDDKVHSAPVLREKIEGGRAQITGNFSMEEAHDLAIVLRAGALPAPVTIMEERTVGPTLGSDSIHQGVISSLVGGGLVILFMGIYYKGFGWLANVAVVFNVCIVLAVLAALQAALTLPGIAGVVLLIGIAVDANVLIIERIREELRLGKSPYAAIDQGYDKAFLTILDSHVTTLATALILFQFGTGPVRGFAVTLIIGIVSSLFTSITLTRMMLHFILRNRRIQKLSL
ncbi:MAG: protein translocase subunit SecD [Magnetococcales bacterium]|nr:protein translocase subunit SecD [Magnetococcales bacterium]NGZ06998.1 protein translocase subunit SecD [Magnetococcales bacterium]